MKVVILAGGFGTRISEESHLKPKPMIEIGNAPILWHIMKYYSHYGYSDFVICAGYKANVIKEFFSNYFLYCSDITFDFTSGNSVVVHNNLTENWRVTVVDTGLETMTAGRIKRVRQHTENEPFMLTYGDGVCDVDLQSLLSFHKANGKMVTMTSVAPTGRFGVMKLDKDDTVISFTEKGTDDAGWINGGFMVVEPEIFDFIDGDASVLERDVFGRLLPLNQICAYKHSGFWQCMDTMRDKKILDDIINEGSAPWIKW